MANAIKANILEGISQFVSRDELNDFVKKSYLTDWGEKYQKAIVKIMDEHGLISTQGLEDRLQKFTNEIMKPITENPQIAMYIDERIQYFCWVMAGRYIEVGYHYNWDEIKSHNLSVEHVKTDYRKKMD
ncbi:hypothetical protein LSTR_LSTR011017 [Laodelphax striatellus]|uniref:Uncharacterized protein n=1 Tax=Laodelphax striatellus TaxID=195883 RepID=A0A482XI49_LAOST|nr:hypothetical protein LSTR_LSTR011017 [Laodelphax striatellus]